MKKNIGAVDRGIRVALAVFIGILLVFTDVFSGTMVTILAIVAIGLLLTSLVSICPAYLPFRISTRPRSE